MSSHNLLKSCLPDERQRLLLSACLETDAVRAGEQGLRWLEQTDMEKVDHASGRMLGLFHWQMEKAGVVHPKLAALKALFRHTWAANQANLFQVVPVVEAFEGAGISTLLIKGLPLAFSVYPDPGTRPMGDSDLLVPSEQAEAAIDLLIAMGAVRTSLPPTRIRGWTAGEVLRLQHAAHFNLPKGAHLDLHWFSLEECCSSEADGGFWARRVQFVAAKRALWTLSVEDQLLHLCVHGMRAERDESSFRWIADATWVMRRAGDSIRWEIVIEEARKRIVSLTLVEALAVLVEMGGVSVPEDVLRKLRAQVGGRLERWAFQSNVSTSARSKFATLWLRFVRTTPRLGFWRRLWRFPGYLRGRWTMGSYGAMIRHGLRRVLGAG